MGKFEGFSRSDKRKKAGEKPVKSGIDFAARDFFDGTMSKDVRGDNQDTHLENRAYEEMLQQRADGMTRQECIDKQKEILEKCIKDFFGLKRKMLEEYQRRYYEKYLNIRKKYADLLDSNYQAATKHPFLFKSHIGGVRRDQAEIRMRMLAHEFTDLVDTMQKSIQELKEIKSAGATSGKDDPNEDAFFSDPESSSYGVFDGVGGYKGGHIASATARNYILREFKKPGTFSDGMSPKEVGEKMREILKDASRAIYEKDPQSEMSTTATVVKIIKFKGKVFAVTAYIGDSPARCYPPKESDTPQHLTNDAGEKNPWYLDIQKEMANLETFTDPPEHLKPYVAERHGLYGALGGGVNWYDKREPSVHIQEIERGDTIVIMSDGISENLTDKRIAATLKANLSNPEKATNALMNAVDEKCKIFQQQLSSERRELLRNLPEERQHPLGPRWNSLAPEEEDKLYSEISDELRAKPDDRTVIVLKCGEKITSRYLDR